MKQYSFLVEFQAPELLSRTTSAIGTAMPYANGALGSIASVAGIKGSISKGQQDSFNNQYMERLFTELCKVNPNNRVQALRVLSKYTINIDKLLAKYAIDKKTQLKTMACKKFMINNFYTPLKTIIEDVNTPDWKNKVLQYIHKNTSKINFNNNVGKVYNIARSTALGVGALGLMGVVGPAAATAATTAGVSLYLLGSVKRNLRFFTGHIFINKMIKELKACPDSDRETAKKIVNKYCYDITNYINTQVAKTKKTIPFSVQQKMRMEFLDPLIKIIDNPNNRFWKMQAIDFVSDKKVENAIQNISQTALDLLMPAILRK